MTVRHVHYVRGPGMVKPVHAQHLLFQDMLQNSLKQVLKESSKFLPVALLHSFSTDPPTRQAITLPASKSEVRPLVAPVCTCCRDFTCTVLLSHKRQGILNWTSGKDLYTFPDVCSAAVSKVKTNSSQKKISMACEI